MRVTDKDRETIAAAITPYDTAEVRESYRTGQFPRAELAKDLDKRYRWDLYWHAVSRGHSLPDSTHGYNDAHIDTALRAIVAPLGGSK